MGLELFELEEGGCYLLHTGEIVQVEYIDEDSNYALAKEGDGELAEYYAAEFLKRVDCEDE